MSPFLLFSLLGTGLLLTGGARKHRASPKVDGVTGASGANWFVETLTPRGENAQGIATLKVYDERMRPILSYKDGGDHKRALVDTYEENDAHRMLAMKDFGLLAGDANLGD